MQFCFVQGEPCTHQCMAKSDSQVVYEEYLHSITENCITSFILIASFKAETKRNSTELSKHIWQLKDRKLNYEIT